MRMKEDHMLNGQLKPAYNGSSCYSKLKIYYYTVLQAVTCG